MYSEPLFTVESALWCEEVGDDGIPGESLKAGHLSKPIYFWVRLRATNEKALQLLQEIENPVVIKLFRSSGYGTSPEWSKESQLNELMLTDRLNAIERKRAEFKDRKEFTYTTWQKLEKIQRPGIYVAKLVFYDNSALSCDDSPCSYQIKIDK